VDAVHGHSSHHALGIEVYRRKLILYGCGDLISDYEGIGGHEEYRSDLKLMYFASFAQSSGDLESLRMVPVEQRWFRLMRSGVSDVLDIAEILNREGRALGTRVVVQDDCKALQLCW